MSWLGWSIRTDVMQSGGFICPACESLRTASQRRKQRAFFVAKVRVSTWLEIDEPPFVECEFCGHQVENASLHDSPEIARLERQMSGDGEVDESPEPLSECPTCGRENAVSCRVCPRCETRFDTA